MTKEIQWVDGAVCYADGQQWAIYDKCGLAKFAECAEEIIACKDFQLNHIRAGDYIEVAELDTEQKYDDVVEVFGLFGFEFGSCAAKEKPSEESGFYLSILDDEIWYASGSAIKRQLTYTQIIAIGKLKRMMEEREKSATKEALGLTVRPTKVSANKYEREITDRHGNSATVDVYDVLKAFEVTCPATQHAVKKLLCSGLRGHKDLDTDLEEAKESINRAIELAGIK